MISCCSAAFTKRLLHSQGIIFQLNNSVYNTGFGSQCCKLLANPLKKGPTTDSQSRKRFKSSHGIIQDGQKFHRNLPARNLNNKRQFSVAILRHIPKELSPYFDLIRFDRPIGSWLLFFPGAWSIGLAAEAGCLPDLKLLGLFAAGAVLMRGAGCVINDMWDHELDKKVERTKSRPLASSLLNHKQALAYLSGLLTCSLGILCNLNWYSIFLGAASVPLVAAYPLMKRWTNWPQLFLGATINWGALIGWSAVHGACDWSVCLPLYTSGIAWTVWYDTIYAHQDKKDDLSVGVKSTALFFGDNTKPILSAFGVAMVTSLTATGYTSEQVWPFYLSVLATASHLSWQITSVDLSNMDDCAAKFRSNRNVGFILLTGIVLSTLLKTKTENKNIDDNNSK